MGHAFDAVEQPSLPLIKQPRSLLVLGSAINSPLPYGMKKVLATSDLMRFELTEMPYMTLDTETVLFEPRGVSPGRITDIVRKTANCSCRFAVTVLQRCLILNSCCTPSLFSMCRLLHYQQRRINENQ